MFLKQFRLLFFLFSGILLISCADSDTQIAEESIDVIVEDYIRLCLEIGHYDKDFVDAYFGPEALIPHDSIFEGVDEIPFDELKWRAITLLEKVELKSTEAHTEEDSRRLQNLEKQLQAVVARLYSLVEEDLPFDKESKMLYDAIAPSYSFQYYDSLLEVLNELLPGMGSTSERYRQYADRFIIPPEKLDTLFHLAIDEAKKRTTRHIHLPENESFTLEYVNDKPWSGYNWYKGNSHSIIQINTDLPVSIDRVIDLASHEGYPGHHVFNILIEENLVKDKNWLEYSIYPLFSPQSLVAEGSANYGIQMAFPLDERIRYEREVLWPIIGLPIEEISNYYHVQELKSGLSYAGNDIARKFFKNELSEDEAVDLMMKYLLASRERAEQVLQFIKRYRSYIINYNYGKDLIKSWMENQLGENYSEEKRWIIFADLLSFPQTASQLKE